MCVCVCVCVCVCPGCSVYISVEPLSTLICYPLFLVLFPFSSPSISHRYSVFEIVETDKGDSGMYICIAITLGLRMLLLCTAPCSSTFNLVCFCTLVGIVQLIAKQQNNKTK